MTKYKNISLLGLAVLVLACLGAYWPGLYGPFVFDDLTNIALVPQLRLETLDLEALQQAALANRSGPLGRPLASLSFALNYYFTYYDTFYFKLTNVIIHVLSGVGLFFLAQALLHQLQRNSPDLALKPEHTWSLALAISALWLLHPLNLTSVLYIVQRMASLSALFVIYGLLLYVTGRRALVHGKTSGFASIVIAVIVFTGLASLSKENGILLPAYVLLIELIFFRFAAAANYVRPFKWLWFGIIALPLTLGALVFLLNIGDVARLSSYAIRDFDLWERLLTESRVLWFYVYLILIPNTRSMGIFHDDIAISHGLLDPLSTLFALAGICALLVAAFVYRRRQPVFAFAVLWFFVSHSLESTLIPLELVHEHRNYLAMYGILFAAVFYGAALLRRFPAVYRYRYVVITLCLASLFALTFNRSLSWRDEWTLYNHTVNNHPHSASAHTQLAILLHDNQANQLASRHFAQAAELATHDPAVMSRYAQHLFLSTGEIPDAVLAELEHRLMRQPFNRASFWVMQPLIHDSFTQQALNLRVLAMFERVLDKQGAALAPGVKAGIHRALALSYTKHGRHTDALAHFTLAATTLPLPADYLHPIDIYIERQQWQKAKALLKTLNEKNLTMTETEKKRFDELQQQLSP